MNDSPDQAGAGSLHKLPGVVPFRCGRAPATLSVDAMRSVRSPVNTASERARIELLCVRRAT